MLTVIEETTFFSVENCLDFRFHPYNSQLTSNHSAKSSIGHNFKVKTF